MEFAPDVFWKFRLPCSGAPRRAECETVANMAAQGAQSARQSQTWPPRAPRMRDSRKIASQGSPVFCSDHRRRPTQNWYKIDAKFVCIYFLKIDLRNFKVFFFLFLSFVFNFVF